MWEKLAERVGRRKKKEGLKQIILKNKDMKKWILDSKRRPIKKAKVRDKNPDKRKEAGVFYGVGRERVFL